MSIVVTSNGLTVTATIDLSVIPVTERHVAGVWINWGDGTASTQPNLYGDYGMDRAPMPPIPYPPGPRGTVEGSYGQALQGAYGTLPGTAESATRLDLFYNEEMSVSGDTVTAYSSDDELSVIGDTATATHTYSSPGDYQIFATQLDKGLQDPGDDGNYDYNHFSFLLPASQNSVTAAQATQATHRVNVTARNVDHWSWSLDGGPDNMMPAGSTYADITIGEESEQLPDLAYPVECDTGVNINRVINTGKGFTSITDMQALIPAYPATGRQFIGGSNQSRIAQISFGLGTNPSGQTDSALDSEGKLTKWCMNNLSFDVPDDSPGPHYLYFFSNPLSLWVKARWVYMEGHEMSEFVWNEGWQPNNWSSTPPDLTKNHAIIEFFPNYVMTSD